jgi:Molybdate transporter of MFS superfamily
MPDGSAKPVGNELGGGRTICGRSPATATGRRKPASPPPRRPPETRSPRPDIRDIAMRTTPRRVPGRGRERRAPARSCPRGGTVTAAVSRQLFPNEVNPVTERNLALTTGLGNLLAAPFVGYLMCHGAGGTAGHFRFGARTATAPVLIGLVVVALGIGFGESGYAVVGGLLLFSGLELALSSKPQEYRDAELFLVLLMAAIGVALNPVAAFVVGLPLALRVQAKMANDLNRSVG